MQNCTSESRPLQKIQFQELTISISDFNNFNLPNMEVPVNTALGQTKLQIPISTSNFNCKISLETTYIKSKHGIFDISKVIITLMGLISYGVVGLDTTAGLGWIKFTSWCTGLSFGVTLAMMFVFICSCQAWMCCGCNNSNINFTEWWNLVIGTVFFVSAFGAVFTTNQFKGQVAYGGLVAGTIFAWAASLLHLGHYYWIKKNGRPAPHSTAV